MGSQRNPEGYYAKRVKHSRNVTGETVTISKGEMAKLHANYAGDKVFIKKDVAAAVKTIDALQKLPAAMRRKRHCTLSAPSLVIVDIKEEPRNSPMNQALVQRPKPSSRELH